MNNIDRRLFIKMLGSSVLVFQGSFLISACNDSQKETGSNEDDILYFAVITDSHIKGDPDHHNNEVLTETGQILSVFEVPIAFVLITGDLTDDLPSDDIDYYNTHEDNALIELLKALEHFSMPVHFVLGNHDYYLIDGDLQNGITKDKKAREDLLVQKLGLPSAWYSFEQNGILFCCLNSMQNDSRVSWEPNLVGSFGEEQLAWLEDQLNQQKPTFLFFHHPLATDELTQAGASFLWPFEVPRAEGNYDKYEDTEYEGWTDPIYNLISAHKDHILTIFTGHGHWFVESEYESVPVIMGDSIGNSIQQTTHEDKPMRYHIVECNLTKGTFSIYNKEWIYNNE